MARVPKVKLFLISFTISTLLIGLLCYLFDQPLVYGKPVYTWKEIFRFLRLTAYLCSGLVFLSLPLLKWINEKIFSVKNHKLILIIESFLILQIVTIGIGLVESAIYSNHGANPFHYYTCVTNSCIYILVGNFVNLLAAWIFAGSINYKTIKNKLETELSDLGKF